MTGREKSIVKKMLASAWKKGYMHSKTKRCDPFKEYSIESFESYAKMYARVRAEAIGAYDDYGKHYVESLMNSAGFDDEFPS